MSTLTVDEKCDILIQAILATIRHKKQLEPLINSGVYPIEDLGLSAEDLKLRDDYEVWVHDFRKVVVPVQEWASTIQYVQQDMSEDISTKETSMCARCGVTREYSLSSGSPATAMFCWVKREFNSGSSMIL